MGAFIVNVHVRTEDREGLAAAVRALAEGGCWVTAPKDGWATVYEERASGQDDAWIRRLGTHLSGRLGTSAVAFLVHDSDFLCYWLFEHGEVVDEFNSCPDYFDEDDGPKGGRTAGGRPEVLLRFCKPGSRPRDLRRVLELAPTFSEEQLQELAALLGIDGERALADYRDLDETTAEAFQAEFAGEGESPAPRAPGGRPIIKFPGAGAPPDDAEGDEGEEVGTKPRRLAGSVTEQIARMMGFAGPQPPADPQVAALVQAAADGNVPEVERLVAAGANLEGAAPMKPPQTGPSPLSARMLAGGGIAFPVTPLLAAVAHKRVDAARRLVELGADVHGRHHLFGSPLHGAVSAGSPELVRLLLDAGADVNERNARWHTPLEALRAVRTMLSQLGSFQAPGGRSPQKFVAELNRLMPTAGWDECERLLRDRGGR
jgi:hypothetical protein